MCSHCSVLIVGGEGISGETMSLGVSQQYAALFHTEKSIALFLLCSVYTLKLYKQPPWHNLLAEEIFCWPLVYTVLTFSQEFEYICFFGQANCFHIIYWKSQMYYHCEADLCYSNCTLFCSLQFFLLHRISSYSLCCNSCWSVNQYRWQNNPVLEFMLEEGVWLCSWGNHGDWFIERWKERSLCAPSHLARGPGGKGSLGTRLLGPAVVGVLQDVWLGGLSIRPDTLQSNKTSESGIWWVYKLSHTYMIAVWSGQWEC